MSITYRHEKGSPLTVQEIDGNFKELETRLKILEDHAEEGEGIEKIHLEGDRLTFTGTFGKDFGTFTLPKPSLNPCGPWSPEKPYKKLDLVTVESGLYYCAMDHTSTTWTQDTPFWKQALTFPKVQPQQFSLPLYEKASLPETDRLGKLGLLLEEEGATLIFFNGKNWQCLMKGESL